MKLDFPRYTERLGAVSIHAVQRIYELDSGKSKGFQSSHQTVRKFDYDEISNILHDLAIVIPVKNEKLKLLEGVRCLELATRTDTDERKLPTSSATASPI